jgi:acyl-CoA thioester hydrolase
MAYPAPYIGRLQSVEPQWADYNGHLNLAYYHVIFDRAGDEAFSALGLGPDYIKTRNCSFFTVEAHVSYLREMAIGESVRVETQILDHDAKRVHYVQLMYHAGEGWLSAVSELMIIHMDMAIRRTAPFPADIAARIAEAAAAHRGLPVPAQVGHRIAIPGSRRFTGV